jgi:SAM-dependent methyltransferase
MKTKLSTHNPFRDRPTWAYAFEAIPEGIALLDYGCFNGEFIDRLTKSKRVSAYGVDKNSDVLAKYKGPNTVTRIDKAIPYPNATFDIVTMFDVLEHIYDQSAALREIRRVLKPGGLLVVTVPRFHVFSFLDLSNWKYIFPGVHKFFYTLRHSAADYDYRYANNPNGLIGDVEKEKAWHQHFQEKELVELLVRNGFDVDNIDGYGFAGHVMTFFSTFGLRIFPESLRRYDNYNFDSREFACRFVKTVE